MNDFKEIFYDLETLKWSDEVEGGWDNIRDFGLSVAVTCWDNSNNFQRWLEHDAIQLVRELEQADKIIGFNIIRFDHEVLSAYVPNVHKLLDDKSFDILVDLKTRLGFRPSLESVCFATLGKGKLGSGKDPLEWFRQGQIEKVVNYCQKDVELTREIYRYGQIHGLIYYLDMGQPDKVAVEW
jgi:DEAD/DEAH box helicase domain-containing protein